MSSDGERRAGDSAETRLAIMEVKQSSHEDICGERYKSINDNIEKLHARIGTFKGEMTTTIQRFQWMIILMLAFISAATIGYIAANLPKLTQSERETWSQQSSVVSSEHWPRRSEVDLSSQTQTSTPSWEP